MSEAPPGNGKGLDGRHTAKAPISHRQRHRQIALTGEEVVADLEPVNSFNGIGGEKMTRRLPRRSRLPARLKAAIAALAITAK